MSKTKQQARNIYHKMTVAEALAELKRTPPSPALETELHRFRVEHAQHAQQAVREAMHESEAGLHRLARLLCPDQPGFTPDDNDVIGPVIVALTKHCGLRWQDFMDATPALLNHYADEAIKAIKAVSPKPNAPATPAMLTTDEMLERLNDAYFDARWFTANTDVPADRLRAKTRRDRKGNLMDLRVTSDKRYNFRDVYRLWWADVSDRAIHKAYGKHFL